MSSPTMRTATGIPTPPAVSSCFAVTRAPAISAETAGWSALSRSLV